VVVAKAIVIIGDRREVKRLPGSWRSFSAALLGLAEFKKEKDRSFSGYKKAMVVSFFGHGLRLPAYC
jgi:hypothetical protein